MSEQKRYTAQEMREEAKQCKRLCYYTDDYKDERIRAQDAEIKTLKSEIDELRECLKNTMTAMCNYCRSTPEAKGLPCLHGCETMLAAKRLIEVAEGGES